ncbi:carbohydrate binding domain-containing protein [Melittangium boletus]|uniref:carbohydrate binding domain-containing protein n=1 Tax=Melittangium boletus TaxID=83453 RepID=UPI003DA2F51A
MTWTRKSTWTRGVLGAALWAMLGACGNTETPPTPGPEQPGPEQPGPEQPPVIPLCQAAPPAPPPPEPALVVAGQPYSLTWEDDFGGPLGGGQPRGFLNKDFWVKENLGVNNEQQAYTNRECPDHPNDWNYCVENGRLTLLAREERLDCVVWQQCTQSSDCFNGGTCADTGYCLNDRNKNGVWDHDECAAFNGTGNAPQNDRLYTSGRIKSDERVEFRYGYVEFRARMPFADLPAGATPPGGLWPAIWMLGANGAITNGGREDSADWPMIGEVDIMEYSQIKENKALYAQNDSMGLNVLWREKPEAGDAAARPGAWEPNACSSWPNGGDAKCDGDVGGARATWNGFAIDYHQWHTWGFLWDEKGFQIYVDDLPQNGGTPVARFSIGDGATEFNQPMYLILNNAVGGTLGCTGWDYRTCTTSAECANNAACVGGRCQETPSTCVNVDWATQGAMAGLEVDYVRWFHRDAGYPQLPAAACQDGDGDGQPDNLIQNCGFNEDFTSHRTDLFFEGGAGLTDVVDEGGEHGHVQWVRVDNSGRESYSVQVRQEPITLTADTTYAWKVDLKSSTPRTVPVKIVQAHDPWTVVAALDCEVDSVWTTCAAPNFTVRTTDTYKFEIDLGTYAGTYNNTEASIDNMYLGTVARSCQADCTGKLCGDDGCGGTCGTCRAGTSCGGWGQCVAPSAESQRPKRLEAEAATLVGAKVEAGGDSGSLVTDFKGGSSLCWSGVDLTGITHVTARVGSAHGQGQARVRFNDTELCSLNLAEATGGWTSPNLKDVPVALSASGTGTLCLVGVTHPEGAIFSVDYLDLR